MTFEQRARDLSLLHALAIANTPMDPEDREREMQSFLDHKRLCIERYGITTALHAMQYGWQTETSKNPPE